MHGEVLTKERGSNTCFSTDDTQVNFGGFAEGPYIDAETEARLAKRGIWRGAFDRPADWRRAHPRTAD